VADRRGNYFTSGGAHGCVGNIPAWAAKGPERHSISAPSNSRLIRIRWAGPKPKALRVRTLTARPHPTPPQPSLTHQAHMFSVSEARVLGHADAETDA